MRINKIDTNESGFKTWAAALQRTCRGTHPVFEIIGPMMLPVRRRGTAGSPVAVQKRNHAFMGGEKFTMNAISVERDPTTDQIVISALFTPADLELAKTISGMTLELSDAETKLAGLGDWIAQFDHVKEITVPEAGAGQIKASPKSTLAQQREETGVWGSW